MSPILNDRQPFQGPWLDLDDNEARICRLEDAYGAPFIEVRTKEADEPSVLLSLGQLRSLTWMIQTFDEFERTLGSRKFEPWNDEEREAATAAEEGLGRSPQAAADGLAQTSAQTDP